MGERARRKGARRGGERELAVCCGEAKVRLSECAGEASRGRDGDTSSTLGQAQSIEVCFGRTKLTLTLSARPRRSSLPRTTSAPSPPHHHIPVSLSLSTLESNAACYLNGERERERERELATVVGG